MNSGTMNGLAAIWGTSDTDIFAVGAAGTILHFDGDEWTPQSADPVDTTLRGVWGSSAENAYASGMAHGGNLSLLRYDGSTWSLVTEAPYTGHLWKIHGSGPDDVWVGSGAGKVLHYDGIEWTVEDITAAPAITDILSFSPTEAWAVGYQCVVEHYQDGNWAEVEAPDALCTGPLWSIWGAATDDIHAIGGGAHHYGGDDWAASAADGAGGGYDLFGTATDNIFRVSGNGGIYRYDGVAWHAEASCTTENLNGVWVSPSGAAYAVGANGVIVRRVP